MIGALVLLALAAIGYGAYFVLVGRFYISTDDAYVRANNTTLGARVRAMSRPSCPATIRSFAPAT